MNKKTFFSHLKQKIFLFCPCRDGTKVFSFVFGLAVYHAVSVLNDNSEWTCENFRNGN